MGEILARQSKPSSPSVPRQTAIPAKSPESDSLSEDEERTKAASALVAAACIGSQLGIIPRNQAGGLAKQLMEKQGIDPQRVFNNFDYYWSRAKEVDRANGTKCLQ